MDDSRGTPWADFYATGGSLLGPRKPQPLPDIRTVSDLMVALSHMDPLATVDVSYDAGCAKGDIEAVRAEEDGRVRIVLL